MKYGKILLVRVNRLSEFTIFMLLCDIYAHHITCLPILTNIYAKMLHKVEKSKLPIDIKMTNSLPKGIKLIQ
jgi:hypothetical protein